MAKKIGPVLAVIGSDTRGFTDGLSKAQKSLQQFSSTAAIAGVRASAAFAATFGVLGAFALKTGADFELAFANVRKTVEGSAADFAMLESGIRDTAKEFGIAATEIADLARIGGQLGIATQDLDAFTETIAKLSIAASELDPETAARGLARLAALTKEGSGSIEKMANVLAKLGDSLPTTESRILDFSTRVASFGSAVGLSSEEILGLSAGFSALVGGTERAATAVERFLGEMASAVASGGSELEAFADLASMAMDSPIKGIEDFAAAFEKAPIDAITLVLGGMETLSEDGLAPLLQKFDELGISGVRMLSTFAASAKGMDTLRDAMATAIKEAREQTKLQQELSVQLDTVVRQFDRLKVALTDVGIKLFKAFKDQINFVIDAGLKFVEVLSAAANFVIGLGTATKFAVLGFIGLLGAASVLLVVIGTLGGLVVGLSSLFGSFAAALTGTAIAAKLATLGLISFSATTGAASVATGAFTVVLTAAKLAFTSFIIPILAVVVAGSVLAEIFSDMSASAENLSPPMAEAAEELGFFGRISESAKVIIEGVTNAQDANRKSQEANTKATVEAGEAIGTTGKQFGGFLDIASRTVIEFVKIASGINILVDGLNDMNRGAQATRDGLEAVREASVKLGAAQFIAKQQGISLAEAFAQMAKSAADTSIRLKEAAEGNKGLSDSGDVLAKSMKDLIAGFLNTSDEGDRLATVAKGLGIDVEKLEGIVKDAGKGFLDLAEDQIAAKKAFDELTEAINKQAEAFTNLGVAAAVDELNLLDTALQQALGAGAEFSPDALLGIFGDLASAAKAAGKEIGPDLVGDLLGGLDAGFIKTNDQAKVFIEGLRQIATDAGIAFNEALFQSIQPEVFSKAITASGLDIIQSMMATEQAAKDARVEFTLIEVATDRLGGVFATGADAADALTSADDKLARATQITGTKIQSLALAEAILAATQDKVTTGAEALRRGEERLATGTNKVTSAIITNTDGLDSQREGFSQVIETAKKFADAMRLAADMSKLFGDNIASNVLGGIFQMGAALDAGVNQITNFAKAGGGGFKGFASGIKGDFSEGILGGLSETFENIGSLIGPAMAGVQIIGKIISALFKSEAEKIAADIERDFGVKISEALAQEMEALQNELDIGRFESRLLSLSKIFEEAGGIAKFGLGQATTAMGDLMNAVATGTIPAEEGISSLGSAFQSMADEVFEAGKLADSSMLAIIARSRQLGLEVPEITQFIADQLKQAAEGISKIIGTAFEDEGGKEIFGGIQVASVEDAQAQATIFAAGFFATLKEEGLLAAVDAFEPAFAEMKKKLSEFGDEVDFGGIQKFFDIAGNPQFRPLLEGLGGLTEAMTGLGNAGFLTADTFAAMQQQGGAAFAQLQEAGLSVNESLMQMAPFLQEAINASQQFGFELDADTQKMIEQAEAAGIAFKTDPMLQVVEVLKLIAGELGVLPEKLADIGNSATASAETTATAYEESAVRTNEAFDGMAVRGEEAYDRLANAGQQSAQETSAASEAAAKDTVTATEVATEATKLMWTDTREAVGVEFDGMQENILSNYETIIESTIGAGAAVASLGETAFSAVSGFDAMAEAAKRAESAARGANSAAGGGGGGGGDGGGGRAGQFGLTTTVNEPTTFLAGEAGEETVTIDPGGDPGGGGGPSVLVLQIDGKTIGKVLGDLSRTGDVRIHPSAVKDFG